MSCVIRVIAPPDGEVMPRPRWIPERISTTARFEPCPKCHALTIRALDNPVAGIDTRLDPTPLDLVAELQARISGRWTYDLIGIGARKEIAFRDQWRIKKRNWPVLPRHQCPGPVPTTALLRTRRKREVDDEPPF